MKRDNDKSVLLRLIDSFNFAINGLISAVKTERNMKIHYAAAVIVLIVSLFFNLSRVEYIVLVLTIALVIISELFNTAVEKLVDLVTEEYHPLAKLVKDISAGAVLIAALTSVGVGYLIFFDKLDSAGNAVITRISNSPAHLTLIAIILVLILILIFKALFSGFSKGSHLHGGAISGHAALAFCCATIISTLADNLIITILSFLLAGLVAESRIEAKIHTTVEVIFGSILGTLVGVFIFQIVI